MTQRRKSAFEKWFSFSRHRKRAGAGAIAAQMDGGDFATLKTTLVVAQEGEAAQYAHGSSADLTAHLQRLRREFIGQSELLYCHAQLIVLLRREADVAANYARYKTLWLAETDYLLAQLDLRWLVAACDSFIDLDDDPVLRAIAMNGPLLVNTVKLNETERYLQGDAAQTPDQPAPLDALRTHRVGLCDGLSAFIPGTDDTLRNMRWRLETVCALHPLGAVVLTIFDRLQQGGNDNVYLRFKARHTRDKTKWW